MAVRDILRNTASRFPDREAVVAADGRYRYDELQDTSYKLAGLLQQRGVGKGDKIALCFANDEAGSFILCYFALHWIGAVPVPVNSRWAPDEKAFVAGHAQVKGVVSGDAYLEQWEEGLSHNGWKLDLKIARHATREGWENLDQLLAQSAPSPQEPPIDDADLADLLYTSGTTGLPKGVATPEGNLQIRAGDPMAAVAGLIFSGRILHTVPLCGYTGLHGCMLMSIEAGGTQIILPHFDAGEFLRTIPEEKVSTLAAVPSMLTLMMNHPDREKYAYSSLKIVFFASAPMPPGTLREMVRLWPGRALLNVYGQTEAGGDLLLVMGPDPKEHLEHLGALGKPVPGCEVAILDDKDQPLSEGTVGEICLRSSRTQRHYYRNEDAEKQLWRNGWLHTGDVGYIDKDGYVHLTDRKKDMIIRGGYNIFAIEVENVLDEHPDVVESAVVGLPHPVLGEDVVAFVVLRSGASVTPQALYDFCRQRLADYKCPRHILFVDALPRNAMGKVIKAELRDQYHDLILAEHAKQGA
ncbi:MAG: AMP-binding protein [Firmicutes bacterium]|nr:AMP-binding protein [Bacillota bacterium]